MEGTDVVRRYDLEREIRKEVRGLAEVGGGCLIGLWGRWGGFGLWRRWLGDRGIKGNRGMIRGCVA